MNKYGCMSPRKFTPQPKLLKVVVAMSRPTSWSSSIFCSLKHIYLYIIKGNYAAFWDLMKFLLHNQNNIDLRMSSTNMMKHMTTSIVAHITIPPFLCVLSACKRKMKADMRQGYLAQRKDTHTYKWMHTHTQKKQIRIQFFNITKKLQGQIKNNKLYNRKL